MPPDTISFLVTSTALTACEKKVATAAPATPISSCTTHRISSMIFNTQQMIR